MEISYVKDVMSREDGRNKSRRKDCVSINRIIWANIDVHTCIRTYEIQVYAYTEKYFYYFVMIISN